MAPDLSVLDFCRSTANCVIVNSVTDTVSSLPSYWRTSYANTFSPTSPTTYATDLSAWPVRLLRNITWTAPDLPPPLKAQKAAWWKYLASISSSRPVRQVEPTIYFKPPHRLRQIPGLVTSAKTPSGTSRRHRRAINALLRS